jgi:hypothetical protein
MSLSFWIWSHLSFVLVVVSLMLPVQKRVNSRLFEVLVVIVSTGLAFIPMQVSDLSGFALSHIGTLSTSTVILMAFEILACWRFARPVLSDTRRHQNIFWVAAGLLLYPSATGFLEFDIYSLGYSRLMAWFLVASACIAICLEHQLLAVCLSSAILAHSLNIHESPNVWDYLIDPWLCMAAAGQLSWEACRSRFAVPQRATS